MTDYQHHPLCIKFVNALPDTNRICVCDVIHAAQMADRRLVRAALHENMKLVLDGGGSPVYEGYRALGAVKVLNDLLAQMMGPSND